MKFTIIDCMFVIHDMDHLNKSLKLELNISYDVNHHEQEIKKEEIKVPEIKVEVEKEIIKTKLLRKKFDQKLNKKK